MVDPVATLNLFRRYEDAQFGNAQPRKLPVAVVTGFLGAGKTTLLKHILHQKQNLKIACAVNDFASLNLDGKHLAALNEASGGVVQLSDGCFVCSLAEEFEPQVWNLLNEAQLDYLVVECSGITHPVGVIQTLEKRYGKMTRARLDVVLCIVDTDAVYHDLFESGEAKQTLPELQHEQIKCADVVLLNKADLVSSEQLGRVQSTLEAMFPAVLFHVSRFASVDLPNLLAVEEVPRDSTVASLSHEQTRTYTASQDSHLRPQEHRTRIKSATPIRVDQSGYLAQCGYSVVEFQSDNPLCMAKWQDLLKRTFPEQFVIVRAKGSLWFHESRASRWSFHLSGRSRLDMRDEGKWESKPSVQLIFIGKKIESGALLDLLQAACIPPSADDRPGLAAARGFVQERGEGCFELPPEDAKAQPGLIHFRLTGCAYYGLDMDHLLRHGIDPSQMTQLLVRSLQLLCVPVTSCAIGGHVWAQWALGSDPTETSMLAQLWPQVMREAKAVLDKFFRKASRCACGQ